MVKIKISALGAVAFYLLFALDSMAYYFSVISEVSIPLGFVGIVVAAFLGIVLMTNKTALSVKIYASIFLLLLISILILVANSAYGTMLDMYSWIVAFAFFSAGFYFTYYVSIEKRATKLISSVFFILLIGFIVIFYSVGEFNYLRVADGVAMTAMLVLALHRERAALIVFVSTVYLLYLIDSRAALILFICAGFLFFFSSRKKILLFPTLGILSWSSYLYLKYLYKSVENIHNNRSIRLLFDRGIDTSLSVREKLFMDAVEILEKSPLFGEYAYYRSYDVEGGYAHSGLSFVAELGVMGGGLFLLLSIPQFLVISRFIFSNTEKSNIFKLVAMVAVYSIVGIIFAKSYVWTVFYYSAGMSICYLVGTYKHRISTGDYASIG